MTNRLAAFLFGCAVALPTLGQAPTPPADDPFLDRLAGHWVLEGAVLGKPTTQDLDAEWVLGHQYLRLHEVSREAKADGTPRYEAIAFISIDHKSGEYRCLWLDSTTGDGLAIEGLGQAKRAGDTIPFAFRTKDGTVDFLNTFAYDAKANGWTWTLENVKNAKPVPFASFRLARKPGWQ